MIVSSCLIVLGFKLLLINRFNPITPWYDQWDAEGALLYAPIIEGHFNPMVLLSYWNEHRILFTRIINLAVLYGTGLWYPALQMVVNSFIHCATIFTVVYVLTRQINIYARSILILLLTLMYVIPFDAQNTLIGFQSQFYFLVLFSILSIHLMANATGFSRSWLIGLICSVASYFNMASGSLTPAVSGIIMALQLVVGSRERTVRECVALSMCVAISVIAVLFGAPSSSDPYRANSLYAFAIGVIHQASYPFGTRFGLLQYAPSVILIARVFIGKPRLGEYEWSALAIVAWIGSQLMAISFGRAGLAVITSRYTDVLILSLSTNLAIAFHLLQSFWARYFRSNLPVVTLLRRWLLVLCVAVAVSGSWAVPLGRNAFAGARGWGDDLERQTAIMKEFFRSGENVSVLRGKPFAVVLPYRGAQRLAMLASDPTIRSILHPALTGQPLRQDLLLPVWLSKDIRDALLLLMQSGRIFIGIGIGMWLAIPAASLWNHDPRGQAGQSTNPLDFA
jgi:hypothetical protein